MNLFVSGPLMFKELLKVLSGRPFATKFGQLRGYAQFAMKDEGQAAMISFPDRLVNGVIYLDVDEASLAKLDIYQGKRFDRIEASIECEGGEWLEADAYCLKLSRKSLISGEEWDEDIFREQYLQKALESCRK